MCWTDLELCTRDGWPIADLWWRRLHPQSLFHSCDQRKKKKKKEREREERENCFGNWTVLLWLTDLELCKRDGWLIADPWWRQLHPKSLFHSCDLVCEDLVHQKTKRRVWKLFWKLDCLAVMNRSWTVQKKWVTDSWPVMVSASPLKSLPQLWSGMPRLGPLQKQREECELKSVWKLDCLELCTREGVTNSRPAMVSASPLKSLSQLL